LLDAQQDKTVQRTQRDSFEDKNFKRALGRSIVSTMLLSYFE
jgi:hypothetical protein